MEKLNTLFTRRAALSGLFVLGALNASACSKPATQETRTTQNPQNKTPRTLIVLTNHAELGATGRSTGFYLSEVAHPYYAFTEAGFQVDFASPKGGLAPMDGIEPDVPVNARFLKDEALVERTRNTLALSQIDPRNYDVVFFAGGHGVMWDFAESPSVQKVIREVYEQEGIVAAVCHGPAALINAQLSDGSYLVSGKRVTGFTNEEEEAVGLTDTVPFLLETTLKKRGALTESAAKFQENVVVDGRLLTGQNPASAEALAQKIVALVHAKE